MPSGGETITTKPNEYSIKINTLNLKCISAKETWERGINNKVRLTTVT